MPLGTDAAFLEILSNERRLLPYGKTPQNHFLVLKVFRNGGINSPKGSSECFNSGIRTYNRDAVMRI